MKKEDIFLAEDIMKMKMGLLEEDWEVRALLLFLFLLLLLPLPLLLLLLLLLRWTPYSPRAGS